MSIKIYSGYRINHSDMRETLAFMKKFKDFLTQRVKEVYIGNTVRRAVRYFDSAVSGLRTISVNALLDADSDALVARLRSMSDRTRSLEDYGFEAVLFPLQDYTLVQVFSERFEKVFANFDGVEFYGYWNNTDRDPNCTEEEWEQRAQDWQDAYDGEIYYSIPSQLGFTYTAMPENPSINYKDVIDADFTEYIPSLEDRAKYIAHKISSNDKVEELQKEAEEGEGEARDLLKDLFSYQRSREHRDRVFELLPELMEELPSEITKDMLTNSTEYL